MHRTETIAEGVVLHLGDCREILPKLGRFDALVTDPPYGGGYAADMRVVHGSVRGNGSRRVKSRSYILSKWDYQTADFAVREAIMAADHCIVFGGNYYDLPPSRCWLVWDKQNGETNFADCELAWTNLDKPVRMISWLWNGMARKNLEPRFNHPTQKPEGVMSWCINQLPESTGTILDPFMGSGTTGVAAVKAGRKFVGIELEREYFDTACKRIAAATKQTDLFIEKPKPATQAQLI